MSRYGAGALPERGRSGAGAGPPRGSVILGGMSNRSIPNSVAVANGKGGVGKTTLSAALAGLLARDGWNVLAVDADQQGNLRRDLGYRDDAANDEGAALSAALLQGERLVPPLRAVRPNLDVVPGGRRLRGAAETLLPGSLAAALGSVSDEYDLVVIDCPGSGRMMGEALRTVGGVVVPVRADDASVEGLELVAEAFAAARVSNPGLDLVGVALFGIPVRATRVRASLRAALEASLEGVCPVFDAVIRDSTRAAVDMRRWGELPHEYRAAAAATRKHGRRFASAAEALADDYEDLADEIIGRYLTLKGAV